MRYYRGLITRGDYDGDSGGPARGPTADRGVRPTDEPEAAMKAEEVDPDQTDRYAKQGQNASRHLRARRPWARANQDQNALLGR